MTRNEDGSIDLHLYVDRASVEVFAKGNTVAGANQIFPSPRAVGASVLVEGGPAKANIAIYPIKSTWTDKKEVTKAVAMNTTVAGHLALEVGQSKDLQVYLAPASEEQDVTWTVSDPSWCHIPNMTINFLSKPFTRVISLSQQLQLKTHH